MKEGNKVDLFPSFVPRCFEVVFEKILQGSNVASELFIAVSFICPPGTMHRARYPFKNNCEIWGRHTNTLVP